MRPACPTWPTLPQKPALLNLEDAAFLSLILPQSLSTNGYEFFGWIWFPLRISGSHSSFTFFLHQSYPLFMAPVTPRLLGMDSELQHKWLGLVQHQEAHLWIMPQHSYLDSVIVFCLLRVLLKITSGTELDVINPETVKSCPSLRMMIPKTCKLLLGKSFQNQSAFNRQKPCPFLSQNNKS